MTDPPLQLPEQETMGRTLVTVNLTNEADLVRVAEGTLDETRVRRASVDALVDTGAAYLCLPPKVITELGLQRMAEKEVKTANGPARRGIYSSVRFEVMGRDSPIGVMENPPDTPPLLGYLPLEAVDLQVDPSKQILIGNPEHGGDWIIDMY